MTVTKEFTKEFASKFKQGYSYKMGGTQTVILPNGQEFYFDDREYYSGRGAKYNSTIKHDIIGDVIVTNKQLREVLKSENERKRINRMHEKEMKIRDKRIAEAEKQGIYTFSATGHVELSEAEREGNYIDYERLANTLKISVEDARLLKSMGKTYVFTKSENGNTYLLFHPSLFCNRLSVHVSIASEDMIAEFNKNRADWVNAPYAHEVGQTGHVNHFAC